MPSSILPAPAHAAASSAVPAVNAMPKRTVVSATSGHAGTASTHSGVDARTSPPMVTEKTVHTIVAPSAQATPKCAVMISANSVSAPVVRTALSYLRRFFADELCKSRGGEFEVAVTGCVDKPLIQQGSSSHADVVGAAAHLISNGAAPHRPLPVRCHRS